MLSYCLMPNHYHFLIRANKRSVTDKQLGSLVSNELSNGFRLAQSQYAQYYNDRYKKRGSLFRPKTKSKCIDDGVKNYGIDCFLYILQNPVVGRLCDSVFEWEYSSAKEHLTSTSSDLIDKQSLQECIDLDWGSFKNIVETMVPNYLAKKFL